MASRFRHDLPQLKSALPFITDGGIETVLIFHEGLALPGFASFPLVRTKSGRETLRRYYAHYLHIARAHGTGVILETPTWRANPAWAASIGFDRSALANAIDASVDIVAEMRDAASDDVPIVISGCVGPRGDGYIASSESSFEDSARYHSFQIEKMADSAIDMVTALTMTNVPEAIGVATAASRFGLPVVISFTVETDGRLPTGGTLREAIDEIDDRTGGLPAYYMINCAHPVHIAPAIEACGALAARVRGLRPNASRLSHAELDQATELDDGNPAELALECRDLCRSLPSVQVIGGCCGTDERHVAAMASALLPRSA